MTEFRQYRFGLFLLALVMASAGGQVRAQENLPGASTSPVIVDRKQAARLAIAVPPPEYPAIAKVNYLAGRVQLELTVDEAGKVTHAHVLQGNAILADSALKAARQWVYHPLATAAGPSGFITTVEMRFTLDYRDSSLTPQQAERDLARQIKPPKVVRPEEDARAHVEDVVHLRLLVNDQGEVDDLEISSLSRDQGEAARETIRGWTFHPAHWGTLPIASYLDVDVPVSTPSLAQAAVSANH
jgi:TonB family protein